MRLDLPDVGILLVWHDAGARGQLVRELDEAEVRTHILAAVGGELVERQRHGAQGRGHGALRAPALHLGGHAVVDRRGEAQQVRGQLAVQREGVAVAGGGAERIAVHHLVGPAQQVHVVHERLGIGAEPQAEGRGHRHLRVRVAGQQHLLVAVAEALQGTEQGQDLSAHGAQLVAQEELDVHEDLVVAGPPGVDLLAHLSELAREEQLHLGVDVLHVVLQHEVAGLDARGDALERGAQRRQLVGRQQADALQHPDVRQGALHVVAGQGEVEHAVVADRETLDGFRGGSPFIPKSSHIVSQ